METQNVGTDVLILAAIGFKRYQGRAYHCIWTFKASRSVDTEQAVGKLAPDHVYIVLLQQSMVSADSSSMR